MNDFDTIYQCLQQATSPESVFGVLGGNAEETLRQRYRQWARLTHPDQNLHRANAAQAFQQLQHWYELALQKVQLGTYGRVALLQIASAKHQYLGYDAPLLGDLCDVYAVLDQKQQRRLIKVGRQASNNDLMQNEVQSIRRLQRELPELANHFPTCTDTFTLPDAHNTPRQCNVLNVFENGQTVGQLQPSTPAGVPVKRVLWVLHDVLLLLDAVHGLGLVHGAVLPAHIWLAPNEQQVVLLDWCYSVEIGKPLLALSPTARALYPPEVAAKLPATPATDVFLAVRSIQTLLADQSIPKPLAAFFTACLLPAPHRRVPTAWEALSSLREITQRLYGGLPFRPTTTWQN